MNMLVGSAAMAASATPILAAPVSHERGVLQLIADHKAATASTDDVVHQYSRLKQTIPKSRRKGASWCWTITEVATDDPRWTDILHRQDEAFRKSDEIAIDLLDAKIASLGELTALMAYAVEYTEQGREWPHDIVDEAVDDIARCWEMWMFIKAAEAVRRLTTPVLSS